MLILSPFVYISNFIGAKSQKSWPQTLHWPKNVFYLGTGVTIVARINTHHTFHKNKHFALCSQHLHLKLPYRVPAKTIAPQSIPSCPPNHQELISPHMCRYYENMKNLSITKLESTPLLYISTSTLHWFLPTLLRSCVLFSQLFRTFNAPKTISQMTWSEKITAPGIVWEHFLHLDNSKPHIKGISFIRFTNEMSFPLWLLLRGLIWWWHEGEVWLYKAWMLVHLRL